MNDEEEKQVFDTLATSKQVLDSGAKLLAMRDATIKALEAKLGEWRARAENAELELETARERLEVLDEVIEDLTRSLSSRTEQFLASGRTLEELRAEPRADSVIDELYGAEAIVCLKVEDGPLWTRFGLELRRRAKQREQKR